MKIFALADIHNCLDYVHAAAERIAAADIVLVAGDITTFGGEPHAHRVISALEAHNPHVLAVHGNCDLPTVETYLDACGISLDCRCKTVQGLAFAGLGGSLPVPAPTPNESPEGVLDARLERLKETISGAGPFIFVSHQPPWGTRIDAVEGRHTGSATIRRFIEDTQPILALSGHIHEAAGTDMLAGTVLVNPGPFRRGCYASIEIEAGRVKHVQLYPA